MGFEYWGDVWAIIGEMGVKYWGDVSPHPHGICSPGKLVPANYLQYSILILKCPHSTRQYIIYNLQADLCKPSSVHICDGSESEAEMLANLLIENGTFKKLTKYENW